MKGVNNFISDTVYQKKFEYLKKVLENENFGFSIKNNFILKSLIDSKIEYEHNYYFFLHYYPELLSSYDKIIVNFASLVGQLELKDGLDISILFSYLLWNGYFSADQKIDYCGINNLNRFDFFGLEVMGGQGTCLHFSCLFKDFLNACGYDSAILLNHITKIEHEIYSPNIVRNIKEEKESETINEKILKKIIGFLSGNHAFNLVNDFGNLYIYDVTNLLYIPISDCNDIGSRIRGEFVQGILHPNFSYTFNLDRSSIRTLDLFHQKERGSYYSMDEYQGKSEKLMEDFANYQDLFQDSYRKSVDDISVVSDGVKRLKRSIFSS